MDGAPGRRVWLEFVLDANGPASTRYAGSWKRAHRPLFLRYDVVKILLPDAGILITTFTLVTGFPAVQAFTVALDMQTGAFILPNRVVFAPMAGVTVRPFRILCRRLREGRMAGVCLE